MKHGTVTAYTHGECRCLPCTAASTRYMKRYRLGYRTNIDATGTQRRLQALAVAGWSFRAIAPMVGTHYGTLANILNRDAVKADVARRVAGVYDQLSMKPGPSAITAGKARAKGWLPALAWDDDTIDVPDAPPNVGPSRGVRRSDYLAEYLFLRSLGESPHFAAKSLGVSVEWLEDLSRGAA